MNLDSNIFWLALAFVLVIEGLLPFLSPVGWRKTLTQVLLLKDGQLRFFGMCSILCGGLLIWYLL